MKSKHSATTHVVKLGTPAQYDHKDVMINFDIVRARFVADVKGVKIYAPSLDSMRKKIDEHQALKFAPFDILDYRYDSVDTVRIVNLRRSTYTNRDFVFVNADGREFTAVTLDTPANRKLVDAYQKITTKNRAAMKRLEKEIDTARCALPVVKAENYRVKGAKS